MIRAEKVRGASLRFRKRELSLPQSKELRSAGR
jgi:hypothetical protein